MAKEVVWTDRLMVPIAHFSHAARIGEVIHVGATAGTDAGRRLAGTTPGLVDATAQTERMIDNLGTALGLLGAGLGDLVRLKTYVADPRDMAACREVFRKRLGEGGPCHAIVGSWGFPLPQAAVELDAVAVVGTGDTRWGVALPIGDGGAVASGDAAAQARQALRNLAADLSSVGLSPREVVHVHVTLADIRDLAAFETVFGQVFAPPFPARTTVGAPLAHPDMRVQIEWTAVPGGGEPVGDGTGGDPRGGASPAMIAGDTLYVGGQTGTGAGGRPPDGVEARTRAAWARVHGLLERAGFPRAGVLRTNNVLTDWRHYAGFNAGYGGSVEAPYPPRATVLGQLADPHALVQVEAVAHRRGDRATILQAEGFR